MPEYLPNVYTEFRNRHPDVSRAQDALAVAVQQSGPLDEPTQRLVKLGMAIAGSARGAVRSNARRALQAGVSPDALRHVALLAITTSSFPTAVAGLSWIEEVVEAKT